MSILHCNMRRYITSCLVNLKILIIIPSYKPAYVYGGPIRSVSNLAEALVQEGHDVSVITTTANGSEELDIEAGREYIVDGVKVTYFKRLTKGHSSYSPDLIRALKVKVLDFDVIHIQSWWNLVSVQAAWICLQNRITPIISPRGTLTHYTFSHNRSLVKRLLHTFVGRKLLNQSILLFSSTREKGEALKFVSVKDTEIIPNLLELPETLKGTHTPEEHFKIIFLGRIDPAKNIELLMEVLNTDFELPFHLKMVGTGDEAYISKLKNAMSTCHTIEWIGQADGDDKFKLLAEADLLVLPSFTENYGNVVLESLSQGTPVLISNNVGAKDYILENNLGWVVDGGPKEWREKLNYIWKNHSLREEMRHKAPECIARDFRKNNQVVAYINLYQKHIYNIASR